MSWKQAWNTKITIDDWFTNNSKYGKEYSAITSKSFTARQEGAEISGNASIETEWSLHLNNKKLDKRYKEIVASKEELTNYVVQVENEIERIKSEKTLTHRELDALFNNFTAVKDCLLLRTKRKLADMCIDDVEDHLHKELNMLEKVRQSLIDNCEKADRQINRLVNLNDELKRNVQLKQEALQIEQETLNVGVAPYTVVGCKEDIQDLMLRYISYESWLEDFKDIKQRSETELCNSRQLCGEMCMPRKHAHNQIESQYEITDYAFRKRIYEYQAVLEELRWQKQNLDKEKENIFAEINSLEESLMRENVVLKVAERQNSNRVHRPPAELCQDECTFTLQEQVYHFENLKRGLLEKVLNMKRSYHEIQNQISAIELEITNKNSDLTIDVRCLDIRKGLLS